MTEDKATARRLTIGRNFDSCVFNEDGLLFAECANKEDAALIVTAVNGAGAVEEMRRALEQARRFISNGIEFGYITIPAPGDPAHDTLPAIDAALSRVEG